MELTAQAVLDILSAHMTAELITVSAKYLSLDTTEYGGAVELPVPVEYEFGATTILPSGDTPCIRVIAAEDNRDEMTQDIIVEWYIRAESDRSERVNLRYGEAIKNILVQHPLLDGYAHGGTLHGVVNYPGRMKNADDEFFKGGALVISYYVADEALMEMS
jgi:hypothetical protein